jgi:hypothetical protein
LATEKGEEKGSISMRATILSVVGVTLLLSGTVAADPFLSCQDALNYGYNMASFYVSGVYRKADCTRARASAYENHVFDSIPSYWAEEATTTTPEKAACMLQGSFQGWMDTIRREYEGCRGVAGFETIQRKLLGKAAGALFAAFYWKAEHDYVVAAVERSFAYEFGPWPLEGTIAECASQIDVRTLGVPGELNGALKLKVCW